MSELLPEQFIDALRAVSAWARVCNLPMVTVGGVAASLLGRPRLTRDIDVLVSAPMKHWNSLVEKAKDHGLYPRMDDVLQFANQARVLLLRHLPSSIDIDVMFGALPFEEATIAQSSTQVIADFELRLPRVEDLMVMKAVAHRPRDMADIEGLLTANPNVDISVARRWVREFANASAMPDLLKDFDDVVAKTRQR